MLPDLSRLRAHFVSQHGGDLDSWQSPRLLCYWSPLTAQTASWKNMVHCWIPPSRPFRQAEVAFPCLMSDVDVVCVWCVGGTKWMLVEQKVCERRGWRSENVHGRTRGNVFPSSQIWLAHLRRHRYTNQPRLQLADVTLHESSFQPHFPTRSTWHPCQALQISRLLLSFFTINPSTNNLCTSSHQHLVASTTTAHRILYSQFCTIRHDG